MTVLSPFDASGRLPEADLQEQIDSWNPAVEKSTDSFSTKAKRKSIYSSLKSEHFSPDSDSTVAQFTPEYKTDVYSFLQNYAKQDFRLAAFHLVTTLLLYFSFFFLDQQLRWCFLIPHALTNVRLFIILHDCGHKSFFTDYHTRFGKLDLNYITGFLISFASLMPFNHWIIGHNHHHKHSNNLDRNQQSQISPFTTEQFARQTPFMRLLLYFIYGPYTVWLTTPFLMHFILLRFKSTKWEFLYHTFFQYFIWNYFGSMCVLQLYASLFFSSAMGFFLFTVQHTFPNAYRRRQDTWDYFANGMLGSSRLVVPPLLNWGSFGIEYHHIHHLNSRIPCYNIQRCHEDGLKRGLFRNVPTFTVWEAIPYRNYTLYNEIDEVFENAYNFLPSESARCVVQQYDTLRKVYTSPHSR
jgi:acyl-lipid omega-6 desaturase (Delta-12 desaturase)